MLSTHQQLVGCRSLNRDSVFDIEFVDYEIKDGYCQLQLSVSRRTGFDTFTVDWGDGEVSTQSNYLAWHNYKAVGRYRVRVGWEVRNWRLWDCYTVDSKRQVYVSRPQIFPRCWSDFLESAQGTYCGWTDPYHGGVQGKIIPWGRSITNVWCCYQFCRNVTGGFPAWTSAMTDATGAFDGCTGLVGKIPKWGRNITAVTQCYCDCPGVRGRFPKWPKGCVSFNSCFKNATGMYGAIPAWPECASELNAVYSGCTGAVGDIPPWPESVTDVSQCYMNCPNLTGAWTDDPAELMPEEKVRYSPDSDYYRCYDVVTGCADSLRALFWDKNWGGTIPRPTTA